MRRILVTGMSGAGKSTALAELERRGYAVVETDVAPWSEWSDEAGGYVWREDLVGELLSREPRTTLYVSGAVSNQGRLYARFDAVVLLGAPADVLLRRVESRTTNAFGKRGDERARIVSDIARVEPLLRATCTHEIDATQPVAAVVAELVAIGEGARVGSTAMGTRNAACHCGQLQLTVTGDPFRVSICHCLACQRRTGSAFGMQAGFRADQVQVAGRYSDFARISDEADRKEHVFHFCPDCGSQVFYTEPTEPDLIVVSAGAFADPSFPPPTESGYDTRRHSWVELPDSIQRHAPELWEPVQPVYAAGRYAEAADLGREILEAHPGHAYLYFNVACCESLAGRTADAVGHLRQAVELWDGCREMARQDSDFDPIRDEPAFAELVGG